MQDSIATWTNQTSEMMKTDDEEETDGVADPPDVDAATTEAVGADEFTERAKAIAIWITPTIKKKLDILKADMDVTWSLFLEVACEQLLASGVVSRNAREQVRALGSPSVDN